MTRADQFRTGILDLGLHSRITPDPTLRTHRWLATAAGADSLFVPDHLIGLLPGSPNGATTVCAMRCWST
ncbi:hypothetical protein [Nocardia sp. NPDC051570]|uniref:hypothetical protein n=1 Tax=Nocardia sp. NPDC051570 TaxID=3364324 RepID=UPI00379C06DB